MKPNQKFTSLVAIVLLLGVFSITASCKTKSFGEKHVVDGTEVYYDKDKVSIEVVTKLSAYLEDQKFTDGSRKSVQIAKDGDKWQFRMVVKGSHRKDPNFAHTASLMATRLSKDVFDHNAVELHLCDDKLKTLKVVQASKETLVTFDGTEIFYDPSNIDIALVEKLGKYLVSEKFTDGSHKLVFLVKEDSTWQFKMPVKEAILSDEKYLPIFGKMGAAISSDVFGGDDVELHMCDDNLKTLKVVPASPLDETGSDEAP